MVASNRVNPFEDRSKKKRRSDNFLRIQRTLRTTTNDTLRSESEPDIVADRSVIVIDNKEYLPAMTYDGRVINCPLLGGPPMQLKLVINLSPGARNFIKSKASFGGGHLQVRHSRGQVYLGLRPSSLNDIQEEPNQSDSPIRSVGQ